MRNREKTLSIAAGRGGLSGNRVITRKVRVKPIGYPLQLREVRRDGSKKMGSSKDVHREVKFDKMDRDAKEEGEETN